MKLSHDGVHSDITFKIFLLWKIKKPTYLSGWRISYLMLPKKSTVLILIIFFSCIVISYKEQKKVEEQMFSVVIKRSLDKCGAVCDSDNLRFLCVWLFTPCSCVSIYQLSSIVVWPLDLHELISWLSFQAHCHGSCERCLMNCLVRRGLGLPMSTHPSSLFLHHFLIYSHISDDFAEPVCFARIGKPLRCE